ncbi:hypothetical protein [Akkermansia glycaniphila]|uniref:Uncharacterized protein n=1 Tax=Akkermansia glycaniphila TaxID=1679444 RepID=A0A1C7PEK0_9BACT|nr:hypothetical protein [Akkermansia glycaniphila]OCA03834.1 hypothetical protein AC781_02485 [Akkermansia glycaniphila]SEH69320.1 Hypothetical protein PYTT_0025 [Akkermansia glycaniphila]
MNKLDFPDYFLPALVKDLRQSLRSSSALITAGLIPCLLAITLCSENDHSFWLITSIILFLLTIVAYKSVKQDIGQHATNFLILTGQTSWRIIVGKWLSVAVQMGLVNLLLLPFIVFASFHYEQPFWLFFIHLLIINAASIILTSAQMFLAGMPFFYRVIGIIAGIMYFMSALGFFSLMADVLYEGLKIWDKETLQTTVPLLLVSAADTVCIILLFLTLARRFYASPSENCALPLRQLSFIVWGITAITVLTPTFDAVQQFIFSSVYCLFAVWLDMTLPSQTLLSHKENLSKHPLRIRPSFLSLPGWAPAYFWGIVLLVLHAGLLYGTFYIQSDSQNILGALTFGAVDNPSIQFGGILLTVFSILYTITVPLIILNPMRRWLQNHGPVVYAFILMAIALVFTPILTSIPDLQNDSPIVALIPGLCLSGTLFTWFHSIVEQKTCLMGSYFLTQLVSTAIAFIILCIQAACTRTRK